MGLFGCTSPGNSPEKTAKEIYEWRIYTLNEGADAAILDDFFRRRLIPAYNNLDVPVGAFTLYKEYPDVQNELRYLLFVYPDIETFRQVTENIWDNPFFREDSDTYFLETGANPVYANYESYLCEAFDSLPQMKKPGDERGLFELRIYRSPNVDANERKILMFNNGEMDIFREVGINEVCYGKTLVGPRQPSLVYLTWATDESARNEAWARFREHPQWIRMKGMSQYKYTATDNVNRLLAPLPYSQF